MKSKLLPVLLIVLIILNMVLIFMLIKKPHENRKNQPKGNFLVEQLQFSEDQNEKFIHLDKVHRETMVNLDQQIRKQRDLLFNSFADENMNVDSLIINTGNLEVKKEKEVFRFFKSVRKICTPEQQKKFDVVINEALKGGKPGPPREGENHPPRNGEMPPPR